MEPLWSLCGATDHIAKSCADTTPTSALTGVPTGGGAGYLNAMVSGNFVDIRDVDSSGASSGTSARGGEAPGAANFSML